MKLHTYIFTYFILSKWNIKKFSKTDPYQQIAYLIKKTFSADINILPIRLLYYLFAEKILM